MRALKLLLIVIVSTVGLGYGYKPALASRLDLDYIIKLKPAITQEILHGFAWDIEPLFQSSDTTLAHTFTFRSAKNLHELKSSLTGYYEYVALDQDLNIEATEVKLFPNDPGFSKLSKNIDRQWGLHSANFIKAWGKTKGSKKVIVAVVDTGIDMTHQDFKRSSFVNGFNVLDDKLIRAGTNSDDHGHGTLVTGVIAAATDNNQGIAGAAPGVRIMPVKALRSTGTGRSSKVAKAITWAVDNKANIINLSLGGSSFVQDKTLADAIAYAFGNDVTVIAAAGNDSGAQGVNIDSEPVFPICHDNGRNMVIGVTAIDVNNQKPLFANFGKSCVDVAAPGKRILSTANHDPATGGAAPDAYAYASGTSLAVPFVSAQAALLKSMFPEVSSRQIRDRIITTAQNIDTDNPTQCGGISCAGFLGAGKIDVDKSLEEVILPLRDRDLVKVKGTHQIYLINGLKRELISDFVRNQRFAGKTPRELEIEDLYKYPEGSYALPQDGTLVKTPDSPTVYYISQGTKLPIISEIFLAHKFVFQNVVTLTSAELSSWVTGKLLAPPNTYLVKTKDDPTVYWPVAGVLRPVTLLAYQNMGLNVLPTIIVTDELLNQFSVGEPLLK